MLFTLNSPPLVLKMSDLESALQSSDRGRTLSTIYNMLAVLDTSRVSQLFTLWQRDIPDLADDGWEEGIQQYLPLTISARGRLIQLKFMPITPRHTWRESTLTICHSALNVARITLISFMWSGPAPKWKGSEGQFWTKTIL